MDFKDTAAKVCQGAMRILGKLPLGFHYGFGRFAGWVMKDVMHYRKDVIYTNLARSFPELKYKEPKKIAEKN